MDAKKKKKVPLKIQERKQGKADQKRNEFLKKNEAFLSTKLDVLINLGDGKERTETFTIKELVHRISYLHQGAQAVEKFTMTMAKHFYAACPSHPFFAGCDAKFMQSLKEELPDPAVSSLLPKGNIGKAVVEKESPTDRLDKSILSLAKEMESEKDTIQEG